MSLLVTTSDGRPVMESSEGFIQLPPSVVSMLSWEEKRDDEDEVAWDWIWMVGDGDVKDVTSGRQKWSTVVNAMGTSRNLILSRAITIMMNQDE